MASLSSLKQTAQSWVDQKPGDWLIVDYVVITSANQDQFVAPEPSLRDMTQCPWVAAAEKKGSDFYPRVGWAYLAFENILNREERIYWLDPDNGMVWDVDECSGKGAGYGQGMLPGNVTPWDDPFAASAGGWLLYAAIGGLALWYLTKKK